MADDLNLDPTPDMSALSPDELMERLVALNKWVDRNLRRLASSNPPIVLDPTTIVTARVEHLINMLVPDGTRERAEFELAFHERQVVPAIKQASEQQRTSSLVVPR
jgi:hypothetical protein